MNILQKLDTFSIRSKSVLVFCSLLTQGTLIFAQDFQQIASFTGITQVSDNNGLAVADFDGDGDLDLFIVAIEDNGSSNQYQRSRLFSNNNDGTFTDVTDQSGLVDLYPEAEEGLATTPPFVGYQYGAFWGDYDNDGYPDLLLTSRFKVHLFHNQKDGTFLDVSANSGLDQVVDDSAINDATWFDYNNDGYLDLYISNWELKTELNLLYKGNGDGTFENVSSIIQGSTPAPSYQSIPYDFNDDGWLDLLIANDGDGLNEILINEQGNSFVQATTTLGFERDKDDMCIAIGDPDNDGNFDFVLTAINENGFFRNRGDNTFEDVAAQIGVEQTEFAWAVTFTDFDHDRDEDLFILNGYTKRELTRNYYFENNSSGTQLLFNDRSTQLGFEAVNNTLSQAVFDFDKDGDLDIAVTSPEDALLFYENKTIEFTQESSETNWLMIELEGSTSNRDAIGTKLVVETAEGSMYRYYTGKGILAQNLQAVHFGLADSNEVISISINWPSGLTEVYQNYQANSYLKIKEGEGISVIPYEASQKVYGCMDVNSCNYNPYATIATNYCRSVDRKNLTGKRNVGFNSTETYVYPKSEFSTLSWSVTGGEIIENQGNGSVVIQWGDSPEGEIVIVENIGSCSSGELRFEINIRDENQQNEDFSIARSWNEVLLEMIRKDFARPTVHARNLFHTSVAMYDAWSVYEDTAKAYLLGNEVHGYTSTFDGFSTSMNKEEAQIESISYAVYRVLEHRFTNTPNPEISKQIIEEQMAVLGLDINFSSTDYSGGDPRALGNYIAQQVISYGLQDGSNELNSYASRFYEAVNEPLILNSNSSLADINPNRWQPLSFDFFIDQSGNLIADSTPEFIGPEWGNVSPFSLASSDRKIFSRNGGSYTVYHDPGAPPQIDEDTYKWAFSMVSKWGSHLDANDGVMWDISPAAIGSVDYRNFPSSFEEMPNFYDELEGNDIGEGRALNPFTSAPYETQMVPRGDYTRVLAEFWADGPDSETPPGHWFTILNYVSDNPALIKRFKGEGPVLSDLEWDVKSYLILGGAMHDVAIAAWGSKGWYDYIRPISAIRYMAEKGQSSDESLSNYHPDGIPLQQGFIEVIQEGDPLAGNSGEQLGKIKLFSWKGHEYIEDTSLDQAGVGWILAENWWPYQRPTFVTPPFAGYVSGHSTFSRAAAEVLTLFTGDEYFPGGLGEFKAPQNEFLVFEQGPSVDVTLQWATYRDAADQCSLSRIWGGIHPPIDDIPGRLMGRQIGINAVAFAEAYFEEDEPEPELPEPELSLKVYPNPIVSGSDEFYISGTEQDDAFQLFDLAGKKLGIERVNYDALTKISTLKISGSVVTGFYVLKINNEESLKIVIARN